VKARLGSLSPRATIAVAGLALLVYAAVVWLLVVSPKSAEVSRLEADVVAAESRLVAAQAAAGGSPRPAPAVPVADVLQLVKAMPSSGDQAGLVLELSALATRSGVKLRSISPAGLTDGAGGATMIPVTLALEGTYFKIQRFLRLARQLVGVRGDRVRATGRLFTVQGVELVESQAKGFPRLDGTIVLNAYVYDGPIVAPTPPAGSEDSSEPSTSAAAGSTSS